MKYLVLWSNQSECCLESLYHTLCHPQLTFTMKWTLMCTTLTNQRQLDLFGLIKTNNSPMTRHFSEVQTYSPFLGLRLCWNRCNLLLLSIRAAFNR